MPANAPRVEDDVTPNANNTLKQPPNPDGWDTVFGIRYADVNASIAKSKASPRAFSATQKDGDETYHIEGKFGDWRLDVLTPEARRAIDDPRLKTGSIVLMVMPVPELAYTVTENGSPAHTKVYKNIELQAFVLFDFVLNPKAGDANGGQWLDLRLFTGEQAKMPPVDVRNLVYDGDDMGRITRSIIIGLFDDWFNTAENLKEFQYVFASVNLNAKAAVDHFQWMMPTHLAYGVNSPDRIEDGVLAVLCMTEGRSAKGLTPHVPNGIIPEGERAGILISKERFLSQMLMAGVGLTFSGPEKKKKGKEWPQDYFKLTDNDTTITNTADIYIEKLDLAKEGKKPNYKRATLKEGGFNARLHDTYLEFEILDLFHHYNHVLSFLDVYHTMRTRTISRINDDQCFELMVGDDDTVATHHVVAKQNAVAEWVELGVLAGTLFLSVAGLARAGWLAYRGGALAARGATAAGEAAIVAEGAIEEGEAAALTAEGAAAGGAMLRAGTMTFRNFMKSMFTTYRASVIGKIAAAGMAVWTAEKILDILAKQDAEGKLPKFREFTAGLMTPVKWPDAAEFKVGSASFNGCFHITGDPDFSHDGAARD